MADLVLGPLLRHVGSMDATVWVETDDACEVEVLGCSSPTFRLGDHHYALVHVTVLEPGEACEYEVRLDDRTVWPEPGSPFPPSVIRPMKNGETLKLVFGSCRISAPHEPPYTLGHDEDERGLGVDALYAMAMRLADEQPDELPHALVLLGDQIYAHKPPFDTLAFIEERRSKEDPPGDVVADFEEYARIYHDAWADPAIRWLLSTVPSAMIFDDHEVSDDWNISAAWVEGMRQQPYWNDQIVGGYASYWIYQHLGNLAPEVLDRDDLYNSVRDADDAWPVLRDFAYHAHRGPDGTRWSYHRDFGDTRLLMMDSRGGRVLKEDRRSMVDEEEWAWIVEMATGNFDHLLLGTSIPLLLGPAMHHLQSWDEKLCSGAWGARATRWAEGFRRSEDLDHWASFHDSFTAMVGLIQNVASGERHPTFHHPNFLRRRPPRLPRRSYSRRRRTEPPLPGRLLPPPQRPPEQEVLPPKPRLVETRHPRHAPPGPPRGRPQRTPRLAPDPQHHLLRKPGRHPGIRRPARHHYL